MTRLIQLNTWAGRMYTPAQNFIAGQHADILILQEVTSSPKGKSRFFDMLQNAQTASGLAHSFFSPTLHTQFGEKPIYYGNAILSRTTLEYTYDEFVHLSYKENFEADRDDYNIRLFQHAITTLETGTELHLINYHGYHDRTTKNGSALTERHMRRLADYVSVLKGPVIVAGDFNLHPDAESLKPLAAQLRNVGAEHGVTTTRNFLARSSDPVDMIWISPEIKVDRFEVLPDVVSDHAPLLMEFTV